MLINVITSISQMHPESFCKFASKSVTVCKLKQRS